MSLYVGLGFLTMMTFDIPLMRVNMNMPVLFRVLMIILWPLFLGMFLYKNLKD